jgi:hypothetical protein
MVIEYVHSWDITPLCGRQETVDLFNAAVSNETIYVSVVSIVIIKDFSLNQHLDKAVSPVVVEAPLPIRSGLCFLWFVERQHANFIRMHTIDPTETLSLARR